MAIPEDDKTYVGRAGAGVGPQEISHKYAVLSQLGQGGMGTVYKVRHTHLDKILALKVLQPSFLEGGDMVARFYREARVMARLKHPNIAQVLDIDRDDTLNFYYFVMEYIEGKTLRQYLRDYHGLPLHEVLAIAHQVASALAYAHAQTPPVIHRDIKPSNIMIEDHSKRVVVMDFGIAKELIDDSEVTRTGTIMGTMQYCAPEQMRHEPLDGGTDIYALGMVMYEAYTGDRFFAGLTETQIVGKVLYDPQENIPNFPEETPATFTALVTKAIAKSRQQRYQHIAAFIRDLEACQATFRDSVTLVVPPLVKLTPDVPTSASVTRPTAALPVEETTVVRPTTRELAEKNPVTSTATQSAPPKAKEQEKSPSTASTGKSRARRNTREEGDLTLGVAPPEIGHENWTIDEPGSPRISARSNTAATPQEERRRRSPWLLPLLGLVLLGGLVFAWNSMRSVTPSTPPPVPAPTITRVEPQSPTVRVFEGERVTFMTQADGVAPLRYEWILDGQPVAQSESWTYAPVAGDRTDTPRDVKVQITDRQGQAVERHWQVTVTYISKPPVLQGFAPRKGTIEVISGTQQAFRVDVTDPDRGEVLVYTWAVNGKEAGKKPTLNWTVPDPGKYQIRVVVSDPSGLTVSKDWQIVAVAPPPPPPLPDPTTNAPPQIVRYTPDEALITAREGDNLGFSTIVSDPNGDILTYEWIVDGKRVSRGSSTVQPTLTWKAKGAGSHVVQAIVRDPLGLTATREWQVAVVSLSPATDDTPTVSPPPGGNAPPQIISRTPDATALKTSVGQTLTFEAAATDPDGDDLTYEWFVNGKKTTQGSTFSLSASDKGNRQVELRVTDVRGLKASTRWEVEIGNAPSVPRVVMFTPHQKRYSTYPHLSRFFGIEVEVPGETDPELTYEWKVDGRAVRGNDALYEVKDQSVGTHTVEVTAITSSGARASHQWTVEVRNDDQERPTIWSPQLEIFDLTNRVSVDKKTVLVTGKLRNIDPDRAADNVVVWVKAVNGQGEEIARRMTLPSPQPIEPGRTATFQVQLNNHADALDFRVQVVSK